MERSDRRTLNPITVSDRIINSMKRFKRRLVKEPDLFEAEARVTHLAEIESLLDDLKESVEVKLDFLSNR